MPNYNKVIMAGHIVKPVDVKYTPAGLAVVSGKIATNYKYKDVTEACFIGFTFFGKQAETLANFNLPKGAAILVEGRLKQDSWEKDGVKHSRHNIVGDRFVLLASKQSSGRSMSDDQVQETFGNQDVNEEEIPF